ncbi:hypothetical protein SDC9_123439 [bioreactor metagenome]|uniref:Uncharacterized protein n=1 Tax=bioreactor metagenome TaxID=1076179 RepID=A0A645CHN9_9ZZZZ
MGVDGCQQIVVAPPGGHVEQLCGLQHDRGLDQLETFGPVVAKVVAGNRRVHLPTFCQRESLVRCAGEYDLEIDVKACQHLPQGRLLHAAGQHRDAASIEIQQALDGNVCTPVDLRPAM